MKIDRRIFIGYDSTRPEPYVVCRQSLIDVGFDANAIYPLNLAELEELGYYWRNDANRRSTEFTNSRFLVPFLSGFYGQSLFCDADFLWRKNPSVLFDLFENNHDAAVRVVQHNIKPEQLKSIKMDGKEQSWYPRKNWSSLMLFNNDHPDCMKLVPRRVNEADASWLHQFKWTDVPSSQSLPKSFNYLVGYGYDVLDPFAIHFTDGGPWLEDFRNVEYAKEWFLVQQRA